MRKLYLLSAFAGLVLVAASSMIGPSAAIAAPADPGISLITDAPAPIAVIDVAAPVSNPLTCEAPEAITRLDFHDRYVVRRVTVTFAEADILDVSEVRRRC